MSDRIIYLDRADLFGQHPIGFECEECHALVPMNAQWDHREWHKKQNETRVTSDKT